MPNKSVSYTQIPVVAADLREIRYARQANGTLLLTAAYEVKDSLNVVRSVDTHSQGIALASYPVTIASILSAINAAQGT